jgi:XTP/dITP diphosphohydrolase
VPEAELTFAEMAHSQKAALGHRGRAFAALKPRLNALLEQPGANR